MPDISYFNPSNEWAFDNDDKSSKYIENGTIRKHCLTFTGLISAYFKNQP